MRASKIAVAASAAAAIAAGVILGSGGASAAVSCTNYASPTGSDTAAGTKAAPFKTVTRLASSLNPGETGCLIAGTYVEDVRVPKGRAPGSPIVLASDPSGS